MIPILGVTGSSGSGKTTLIEKLIQQLSKRGYRVGTIKHHHGTLETDKEGKDTWRHKKAGAITTALTATDGMSINTQYEKEPELDEIVERFFHDCDIVIVEGYRSASIPKLLVLKENSSDNYDLISHALTIAVISDFPLENKDATRFSRDDASAICDFVEQRIIKPEKSAKVMLVVDSACIPMKPFVREIVNAVLRGLIGTFKGTENAKKIRIFLDK